MALPTKKIPALPPVTLPLTGGELFEVVQGGISSQTSARAFPLATDSLLTYSSMFGALPGSRQVVPGAGVQFNLTVDHEFKIEIIGTGAVSGNPTALIGMVAINGIAATWMRSDAAPAIDPAINPVWTGLHTISNTNPQYRWNETDAAANNRLWGVNLQGEQFQIGVFTDAGVFSPWVTVDRTLQVIDSLAFASVAFSWTGTTFGITGSLNVTGASAFTGISTFIGAIRDTTTTIAVVGATNLDLSLGNEWLLNLNVAGPSAITFTNPPPAGRGQTFTIFLRQDATGTRLVSWPASVHFSDGLTPVLTTTANRVDAITLTTFDGGTTYYGGQTMANMVP